MTICNQCIEARKDHIKMAKRTAFIRGLMFGIAGTGALLVMIGGYFA